jgi:hypothetical protein
MRGSGVAKIARLLFWLIIRFFKCSEACLVWSFNKFRELVSIEFSAILIFSLMDSKFCDFDAVVEDAILYI